MAFARRRSTVGIWAVTIGAAAFLWAAPVFGQAGDADYGFACWALAPEWFRLQNRLPRSAGPALSPQSPGLPLPAGWSVPPPAGGARTPWP